MQVESCWPWPVEWTLLGFSYWSPPSSLLPGLPRSDCSFLSILSTLEILMIHPPISEQSHTSPLCLPESPHVFWEYYHPVWTFFLFCDPQSGNPVLGIVLVCGSPSSGSELEPSQPWESLAHLRQIRGQDGAQMFTEACLFFSHAWWAGRRGKSRLSH